MKVAGLTHPAARSRQTMCVHKTYRMHEVSILQSQAPCGCGNRVEIETIDKKWSMKLEQTAVRQGAANERLQ